MTRPPRTQAVVIAVSLPQKNAIRHLSREQRISISEFMSRLIPRKAWKDIDKAAAIMQKKAETK